MIDLHDINADGRKLGCPDIAQAGLYLYTQTGDKIKKGEVICKLYAQDEVKLKHGIERWKEISPLHIR